MVPGRRREVLRCCGSILINTKVSHCMTALRWFISMNAITLPDFEVSSRQCIGQRASAGWRRTTEVCEPQPKRAWGMVSIRGRHFLCTARNRG